MPQVLSRQRALQDDLIRAPVIEVEQEHAKEAGPGQRLVITREMQVHEIARLRPQIRPPP